MSKVLNPSISLRTLSEKGDIDFEVWLAANVVGNGRVRVLRSSYSRCSFVNIIEVLFNFEMDHLLVYDEII